MNNLGIALVWLAVQVTAVVLAGLGLSVLAARRAPGAGASAALTALAATVVLAAIACIPLPAWWAWETAIPPTASASPPDIVAENNVQPSPERPNRTATSPSGRGIRLAHLLNALRHLGRESASAPTNASVWGWPAIVAGVAGIGTALGLLRLLLGLWALRNAWQRSRPVQDDDLLRLVHDLHSAQGVARPVDVRESPDLTTAATIGWRKPVLLLPAHWREWTDEQRRAVLAHELVHVARGDFAARLLARLCVALYFWHPLVHWLAGRLHVQQELAADAQAARLSGGRPAYLRALAALALQWDGRPHGWPAPTFFSRTGTLLRRVEMLRRTDDGESRPASRTTGRLTIALLFALALIASGLRCPVPESFAAGPPSRPKPAAATVAPFDLALLGKDDKDAAGVFGIRPAALLNRPGMEPLLRDLNFWIDAFAPELKVVGVHVEDVEQVMGRVYFKGENKSGKRSLMTSLNVLRTTTDVDWEKLRKQCGSRWIKHSWKGETYVSVHLSPMLRGVTGVLKGDACLWAADARTLLLNEESAIKALIETKTGGTKPAAPKYTADWDRVSRGLFAVALDNQGGRLAQRTIAEAEKKRALSDSKKVEDYLIRICQKTSTVVVGVAGDDDFRFDLRALAGTPAAANELAGSFEVLLAIAKNMAAQKETMPDVGEVALAFLQKILARTTVRHKGSEVTIHGDVEAGFNALLLRFQGKE